MKRLFVSPKVLLAVRLVFPLIALIITISGMNDFATQMDNSFNVYNNDAQASLLALAFGLYNLGLTIMKLIIITTFYLLYEAFRIHYKDRGDEDENDV